MLKFGKVFRKKCSIIGMVHLDALPGAPLYNGNINKIVSKACKETEIYLQNNLDGLIIENMHDIPYIKSQYFGPEITSTFTRVCCEIKKLLPINFPCGVQVLTCGNQEAIAIAKICQLNFIRAEGFVFSHIGDEGFIDAQAGRLLRYRKLIDAEEILIFADIKKKHSSHAITNDVSLLETAQAAQYFLADGLIVTGTSTGVPVAQPDLLELTNKSNGIDLPILIGSGVTNRNLRDYIHANALIVGSHFKDNGYWRNDLNEKRVKEFMQLKRKIDEEA